MTDREIVELVRAEAVAWRNLTHAAGAADRGERSFESVRPFREAFKDASDARQRAGAWLVAHPRSEAA